MKIIILLATIEAIVTGATNVLAASNKVPLPVDIDGHAVNVKTHELVDYSRRDPWANQSQPRRLMVSVFAAQPLNATCSPGLYAPYMPAKTAAFEDSELASYGAPNGTFFRPELPICEEGGCSHLLSHSSSRQDPQQHFPTALFSPGLGESRLLYNAICQSVASSGFNVISIDHPYDADIVEFPDGELVYAANISTEPLFEKAVAVRVADARFVLDSAESILPQARYPGNSSVIFFGHSMGGATAVQAASEDARILGALNLDGGMFGSVLSDGLQKPVLLMNSAIHNQTTDPSWAEIWPRLSGPKLQLTVRDSLHGTFTDLPLLADVLGINKTLPPGSLNPLLGSINGKTALQVIHRFSAAWLQYVASGKVSEVLAGPTKNWPEVEFTNGTLDK